MLKLQDHTSWTDRADDQANLGWIRAFYDEMDGPDGPLPDRVVNGCSVNYPDVDLQQWPHRSPKESSPRLQQTRARWDPHDLFNHQQSIRLRRSEGSSGRAE